MTLIEFQREGFWRRVWVESGLERDTIVAMRRVGYETVGNDPAGNPEPKADL